MPRYLSKPEFDKLFYENPAQLFAKLDELTIPYHSLKETGIEHRTILHWEQEGLIEKRDTNGWRKFSFYDYMWLRLVKELRTFGIAIPNILKIKDQLFEDIKKDVFEDLGENGEEIIKKMLNKAGISEEEIQSFGGVKSILLESEDDDIKFTVLDLLILEIIYTQTKILLLVDADFTIEVIILNNLSIKEKNELLNSKIMSGSTLSINVTRFALDYIESNTRSGDTLLGVTILTEKEKQILELLNDEDIEEVTIEMRDGEISRYNVNKKLPVQHYVEEVKKAIGSTTYGSIEITMHNGKVSKLTQTKNSHK